MQAEELKALQAPIKEKYRIDPEAALVQFHGECKKGNTGLVCDVNTFGRTIPAGLHPAAGGDGTTACSGDLLLDALVACAGVTMQAVATAMSIPLDDFTIRATADMDFRGTLGIDREVPVGVTNVKLHFDIKTSAADDKVAKLVELTERYCVIYQTLRNPPKLASELSIKNA